MDVKYCIYLRNIDCFNYSVCYFCKEALCGDRAEDSYMLDERCTPFKKITKREEKRYGKTGGESTRMKKGQKHTKSGKITQVVKD